MDVQKDFADLCSLLNAQSVDFLIVGGYAVAFHGAPRFTGDLDLLIRPEIDHLKRMLGALKEFGFPVRDISPQDLLAQREILQLGRTPLQIHLMTRITGVGWDEAWLSRTPGAYGGVPVFFIGKEALITNKRAAARLKDLADVEALGGTEP
jgi:hypothetical protein